MQGAAEDGEIMPRQMSQDGGLDKAKLKLTSEPSQAECKQTILN